MPSWYVQGTLYFLVVKIIRVPKAFRTIPIYSHIHLVCLLDQFQIYLFGLLHIFLSTNNEYTHQLFSEYLNCPSFILLSDKSIAFSKVSSPQSVI